MNPARIRLVLVCVVLVLAAVACDDDDDPTRPSSAPESHAVSKDGVRHLSGLNDPAENCTTCHGAELRGGDDGEPSCYSCHGAEWS